MKNAAHSAAKRASLQSCSILPDSKPPVGGRCPTAVHKGIGLNRQGASEGSRSIDGSACASGGSDGANCESNSSDASEMNRAPLRRLWIFSKLFSLHSTPLS